MRREPWKDLRRNKNVHLVFLLVAMTRFQDFLQKLMTDKNCRWLPWSTKHMFKFYEKVKIQHMVLTNPSLQCNPFAFPLAAVHFLLSTFLSLNIAHLLQTATYFVACFAILIKYIYPFERRHNDFSCILMYVYTTIEQPSPSSLCCFCRTPTRSDHEVRLSRPPPPTQVHDT